MEKKTNPSLQLAARQVDHCLQLVVDLVLASFRVAHGCALELAPFKIYGNSVAVLGEIPEKKGYEHGSCVFW